jgi:spoIIIJ-associated protein
MLKSIEVQGRTEDEAIELALQQLNMSRDDVSVEILEQARTGFLGLKNTPAIVKVSYEAEDAEDEIFVESSGDITERIGSFLKGLFERMDLDVSLEVKEKAGAIGVTLACKDPGALIGRRGETLDAIQHLTSYVVNRSTTGRVRISLDAENYRARRNEALENLAERTAGKVLKYRRNMTLDPMNAYERHVIHSALQEHTSVSTFSVGSEPNRRVVIAYGKNKDSSERPDTPQYKEWR